MVVEGNSEAMAVAARVSGATRASIVPKGEWRPGTRPQAARGAKAPI